MNETCKLAKSESQKSFGDFVFSSLVDVLSHTFINALHLETLFALFDTHNTRYQGFNSEENKLRFVLLKLIVQERKFT